jgi:hypothetical protein
MSVARAKTLTIFLLVITLSILSPVTLCASLIDQQSITDQKQTFSGYSFHMQFLVSSEFSCKFVDLKDSTKEVSNATIAAHSGNTEVARIWLVSGASYGQAYHFQFSWNGLNTDPQASTIPYKLTVLDSDNVLHEQSDSSHNVVLFDYTKNTSARLNQSIGTMRVDLDADALETALSGEYSDTITLTRIEQ